jgi:hypothetical protein
MARQTEYFVQAFNAGKGGHLKPILRSPANRQVALFEPRRDWQRKILRQPTRVSFLKSAGRSRKRHYSPRIRATTPRTYSINDAAS